MITIIIVCQLFSAVYAAVFIFFLEMVNYLLTQLKTNRSCWISTKITLQFTKPFCFV